MSEEPQASLGASDLDSQLAIRKRRRRQIGFRVAFVLLPVLLVILANLALFWLGIGADTRLIVPSPRRDAAHVFSLNMLSDFAYSNIDLRGPEPRSFDLPKPASTFRVVVVGESSVQGFPYPSELAFPRQLEFVLSRQLSPKRVEVLNAGIVGVSTTPLVDITRQALESAPDLMVVYAGHNEFYGIGGAATTAPLGRLGIELRRYRLMQFLTQLVQGTGNGSEMLIARLPGNSCVPPNSDAMKRAENMYRSNLTKMVALCEQRKVPLVLCSVVSNLHDQSPIVNYSTLGVADGMKRDIHLQSAGVHAESGQYESALQELNQAEQLDPGYALIAYRKAQALEALHRLDEAAVLYSKARDLDGCRYRARSNFRDIVRKTVESASLPRVLFVDLVPTFSEAVVGRVPGRELFWEHVHFTREGHWLVARTLAKRIVEDVCQQDWNPRALPSTVERDEWLGLIPLDQLSAAILTSFIVQSPPLNQASDAAGQLRALNEQIEDLTGRIDPGDMRLFTALDDQTKVDDLLHGIGQMKLDKGDPRGALELFERAQRRRPWMPHSYIYAAICHHLLGNDKQARADLAQSHETVIPETERLMRVRAKLEKTLQ